MPKYLVVSDHTGEDCIKALQETLAIGYLTHFEWGCKDGVHTGWAMLEAENKQEAMMSVPTFLRPEARVIQLTHFEAEKVRKMHPGREAKK
jgi:hypothetical protein